MNLAITTRLPYAPQVEFVERKGSGHPDTICDDLAEKLARRLAQAYLDNTGAVQHFNVDKAILAAGTVDVSFGGGTHLTPARLILVGKADFSHGWHPDREALRKAAEKEVFDVLPDASAEAFDVDVWLGQSASDLALVLSGRGERVPLSNDTSFAAVSLPRSALEQAVHSVETHLNSAEFRADVPVGRDIKVMGRRVGDDVAITVAAPMLAGRVANRAEYDEGVAAVGRATREVARHIVGDSLTVLVNGADSEASPYLTITGTSAESGDDGQVGRGNRFGGLITPYRPMSLEAACGKNPAAHVGKTYHAVAHDIATRVIEDAGAKEATVRMLSAIGSPVTEPQVVHVEHAGEVDEAAVGGIVKECMQDWSGVRDRLIAGHYELY